MKKRGQVLGTPFVMMFALVVGAMILVGGLYYVYKLTKTAEQISIAKEINDFKTTVKAYYQLEEGNSKKVTISLPAKAKNICFFDLDKYNDKGWKPAKGGTADINYPPDFEAKDYETYFKAFKGTSMFVFPKAEFKQSAFEIPYLNLQEQTNNPVCVRNNGEFRIISMGDHVEVQVDYKAP